MRLPVKNLDSVIVHAVRNLPESSDTNFKGIKSNEAFSQELKGNRLKKCSRAFEKSRLIDMKILNVSGFSVVVVFFCISNKWQWVFYEPL